MAVTELLLLGLQLPRPLQLLLEKLTREALPEQQLLRLYLLHPLQLLLARG